jgi:parallel beta-helix repeat protein
LWVLLFFIVSSQISTPYFEAASAQSSTIVTIKADGEIDPPNAPISRLDDVTYTLTGNLVDRNLLIEIDNIVFDGAGYSIVGSKSGPGLELNERKNVTIRNVRVENWGKCIQLSGSVNCRIIDNEIGEAEWGLRLEYGCNGTLVSNNKILRISSVAVFLRYSNTNNNFSNNTLTAVGSGFYLYYNSNNNLIVENNVTASARGAGDYAIGSYASSNNLFSKNNLAGNWVAAAVNLNSAHNTTVNENILRNYQQGLWITSSENVTASQNQLENLSFTAIGIDTSPSVKLSSNRVVNATQSFEVLSTSNPKSLAHYMHDIDDSNTVDGKPVYYWKNKNNQTFPSGAGFAGAINCTNVKVQGQNFTKGGGVFFAFTQRSAVFTNSISDCRYGIYFVASELNSIAGNRISSNSYGIVLEANTTNNEIVGNTIEKNINSGMRLYLADKNLVFDNEIGYNYRGLDFNWANTNNIYGNNFLWNTIQSFTDAYSLNSWDQGYPKRGNYWTDYNGSDTNSDGIGETPYAINNVNQDNFPVMSIIGERVDIIPPLTSHNYDGQWHISDFTVTLNATDDSGVNETYYRVNGGILRSTTASGQPLIDTEGANNAIEFWSVDNCDNEELPHNMLTQIKLDKSTPTGGLQINKGATYSNSNIVNLQLSAVDAFSGVSQMRFSNDWGAWSSWESYSTSKSWNLSAGDGEKTVLVQYKDLAGLTARVYQNITLDTTPPVAFVGQNQTALVGTSVSFNGADSSDNNAVAVYLWDFGDGTNGSGVTVSHIYSAADNYTVRLTVKDVAGNSAVSSATVTIEVVIAEFSPVMMLTVLLVLSLALSSTRTLAARKRRRDIQKVNRICLWRKRDLG